MTRRMVLVMVVEERESDPPPYDAETDGEALSERTGVFLPKRTIAKCGELVELARKVAR